MTTSTNIEGKEKTTKNSQKFFICERCGKLHNGLFGSGRFCSRSCANKRTHTLETKRKIGEGVKRSEKYKSAMKRIRKENKKRWVRKKCPVCKKIFYVHLCEKMRTYCSRKCYLKDSAHLYRKIGNGGFRRRAGRGKKGWYKGIYCSSSWELAFVIYCIDKGIKIERNWKGFKYFWNGKEHLYYPDFIINEKEYVEIKGRNDEQWKAKIENFPYPIKVLYKEDIKFYIEYAKKKFGKNFIEAYDDYRPKYKYKCCQCNKEFFSEYQRKTEKVFCCVPCQIQYYFVEKKR